MLAICTEAGLGEIGTVSLDGVKVKADAALQANRTYQKLKEEAERIIEEAEQVDQQEDEQYGEENCEEEETGKKKRRRKPDPPDPTPDEDARANPTDPESPNYEGSKRVSSGLQHAGGGEDVIGEIVEDGDAERFPCESDSGNALYLGLNVAAHNLIKQQEFLVDHMSEKEEGTNEETKQNEAPGKARGEKRTYSDSPPKQNGSSRPPLWMSLLLFTRMLLKPAGECVPERGRSRNEASSNRSREVAPVGTRIFSKTGAEINTGPVPGPIDQRAGARDERRPTPKDED